MFVFRARTPRPSNMLPNFWQLAPGQRTTPLGSHRLVGGRGKAPWELILELAKKDGWTALYDVSNPNTRTLIEEGGDQRVTRVQDSLENFPDLYGGSDSASAQVYSPDEFGKLEAFQQLSLDARTLIANVSPNLALPYLSLALCRNTSTSLSTRNITAGTSESRFVTGIAGSDAYRIGVSSPLLAFPGMARNTDTHVMSFLFNGSNSKIWMDGAIGAKGSIHDSANQPLSRIVWGSSDTRNSRFWEGYLGLLLIYGGNPSDAIRQRMENLIMELSQVKTYEIPEALDLNGLGLWLDGADETSLFDDPYGGSNVAADGQVARWEDKSNNIRHVRQATSAARPIRKAGAQNGRDVVRFDGTADYMDAAKNLWNGASGGTIIAVYKKDNSSDVQCVLNWSRGSDVNVRIRTYSTILANDHGAHLRPSDSSLDSVITGHEDVGTGYNLVVHRFDLGAQTMRMNFNGTEVDNLSSLGLVGAITDSDSEEAQVGGRDSGSSVVQFFPGDLCEVLAYRRDLTASELRNIEEYLQAKWGTPALP